MINSHISFLFRELNEIVKTIESRSKYDTNGYEIDLIENLKLIKNKLQMERLNVEEILSNELSNEILKTCEISNTYDIVAEMRENNDCFIATKVSRAILKLVGKLFQGIANLMSV